MFYLVHFSYNPIAAESIRLQSYLKGLSELNIEAKVVFFIPDKDKNRITESYPGISFLYLWEKNYINIPRLNKLSLRLYINQFVRSLRAGDIVYVYSFPDIVVRLSSRKDIHIYAEITEHPDVAFRAYIKGTNVESYLCASRNNAGVIVISEGLKQYFINNGCSPNKVHVVNMIVDYNRFKGINKFYSKPYVAYCGKASNNKDGVDQLIQAFSLVVERHPEFFLYIIGDAPSSKQNFENLELTKKLHIEDKVVFTGKVSPDRIPQLLKNATILALDRPDNMQAQYGFPTKLGEYLLTGNPVVVTKVGDIPLFLKNRESAMIATPSNPRDFADKILWLIEHKSESSVIGEKGREIALKHFNYLVESKKLIEIIKKE